MARVLEEWQRAASGLQGRVLTPQLGRELLTPVPVTLEMSDGAFGLGVQLEGSGAARTIGHTGANAGYRARMLLLPASGDGIVVLTNADGGGFLIDEIVRGFAAAYHWPGLGPVVQAKVSVADSLLSRFEGRYRFGPGELVIVVKRDANGLTYALPWSSSPVPLQALAADRFVSTEDGSEVTFDVGKQGEPAPRVELQARGQPPLLGRREAQPRAP